MKKPSIKEFQSALNSTSGNLTNTAKALGCSRTAIWGWAKNDPQFDNAIKETRMKVFDRCFTTAQALAFGIPDTDENGNVIGWIERPDTGMLKYFLSTLGRTEGFAENVDITSNGESIKLPYISKEDLELFYSKQQQRD